MPDLALFSSPQQTHSRSIVGRMYDSMKDSLEGVDMTPRHAAATVEAVMGTGESLVVGAALGLAHCELENGLDFGKDSVPIDGVVGLAGMIGSVAAARSPLMRFGSYNIGVSAFSVLSFRKTHDWCEAKKRAMGQSSGGTSHKEKKAAGIHGDNVEEDTPDTFGDDPILRKARELSGS